MAVPYCMIEGKAIDNVREDFRSAEKVEQYRISKRAIYLPDGLRWKYIPLGEIHSVDESFRVISAGHCVPVREKRPEIDMNTAAGVIHVSLEKQENMRKILDSLQAFGA